MTPNTPAPFVYGIGNALLDIEIRVPESTLSDLGIDKGSMTLMDHDQLNELRLKLPEPHQHQCGGSACNTIVGARQFGIPAAFSGRLSADMAGNTYIQALDALDVMHQMSPISGTQTGTCMVLVTPDADRTLLTALGESAHFGISDCNGDYLNASSWLYIEGYLLTSPSGFEAACFARDQAIHSQSRIALTLSDPNVVTHFKSSFEQLMGITTPSSVPKQPIIALLFCNESEALALTGASTVDQAIDLLTPYAAQVAITCGDRGARIWDGHTRHTISVPPVTAIDTNGAGDLFAGGVFSMLYRGHGLAVAAEFGCFAASQLVEQYGPRMTSATLQTVTTHQLLH